MLIYNLLDYVIKLEPFCFDFYVNTNKLFSFIFSADKSHPVLHRPVIVYDF